MLGGEWPEGGASWLARVGWGGWLPLVLRGPADRSALFEAVTCTTGVMKLCERPAWEASALEGARAADGLAEPAVLYKELTGPVAVSPSRYPVLAALGGRASADMAAALAKAHTERRLRIRLPALVVLSTRGLTGMLPGYERYEDDDGPLMRALARSGTPFAALDWEAVARLELEDAGALDWSDVVTVAVRTAWSYSESLSKCRAFVALLCTLEKDRGVKVVNAAAVTRRTVHKSYLQRFAARYGVRTVPSLLMRAPSRRPGAAECPAGAAWGDGSLDVVDEAARRGWDAALVKPCVGGGSRLTRVFATTDEGAARVAAAGCRCLTPSEARAFVRRCLDGTPGRFTAGALFVEEPAAGGEDMLLQPFVPSVQSLGELSVIVVRGDGGRPRVSHAVRKVPKRGEYRVQGEFGAREVAVEPTAGEAEAATAAFLALAADASPGADAGRSDGLGFDGLAATSLGLPLEASSCFGPGPSGPPVAACRVDMLSPDAADADRRPMVIEVEAIEPSLFAQIVPEGLSSADAETMTRRRADAIAAAILSS